MELTYSNQLAGFDPEKRYRNPEHFDRPESGVTSVAVIGDWPAVVKAYANAGVEVSIFDTPKVAVVDGSGLSASEVDALRRELEAVGLIVESFAGQSLERPSGDDGATSGRLFQVLEAVNSGVQTLIGERDAEAGKVEILTKQNTELLEQIEALKAAGASDPEIEAMKAALTAAGVAFRANASKESLEKLVSELPKE